MKIDLIVFRNQEFQLVFKREILWNLDKVGFAFWLSGKRRFRNFVFIRLLEWQIDASHRLNGIRRHYMFYFGHFFVVETFVVQNLWSFKYFHKF